MQLSRKGDPHPPPPLSEEAFGFGSGRKQCARLVNTGWEQALEWSELSALWRPRLLQGVLTFKAEGPLYMAPQTV